MKLIVNNVEFPFDLGCRVLKLKHGENCPMEQLQDFWNKTMRLGQHQITPSINKGD